MKISTSAEQTNERMISMPTMTSRAQLIESDIVSGRMRYVVTPDAPYAERISVTEYQLLQEQYQQKAVELQKETGAEHVVYAVIHYDAAGETTYIALTLCQLSDEEFYKRVPEDGALVYAIHSPVSEIGCHLITWGDLKSSEVDALLKEKIEGLTPVNRKRFLDYALYLRRSQTNRNRAERDHRQRG